MKKIFIMGLAALALVSCNMDFYSSDTMTAEQLANNPNAPFYTTDGIYADMMSRTAYKGQDGGESGNYYIRHYFQLSELRGDNVTVSGITEDPFINPYRYSDDNTAKNIYYSWWMAYKMINAANSNLAYIKPGVSDVFDHLIGENYFFRALFHFHMVTLYATPYVQGPDKPGVPLRVGTDATETTRATVGEVYDQIVSDLIEAKKFLAKGEDERIPKDTKCYVSLDAARALLARVYLYMEKNEECIAECNELLDHAPAGSYDYAAYPTSTFNSPETIWCLKMDLTHEWANDHGEASIASMYLKDGIGWGEHYWREDLIDLFRRYPDDQRFKAYFRMVEVHEEMVMDSNGKKTQKTFTSLMNYDQMLEASKGNRTVIYPVPGGDGSYCTDALDIACKFSSDGSIKFKHGVKSDRYTVNDAGIKVYEYDYFEHVAKRKIVNGRDTIYYVENSDATFPGKDIDGVKRVWVRPGPQHAKPKSKINLDTGEGYTETQQDADARFKAALARTDNGGAYIRYYNTKFSYQDDKPMLTSPAFLRWGEVWLNRAEAHAKLGHSAEAMSDMNVVRSRAGIPEVAEGELSGLGYKGQNPVLDVVLDERRKELCFEGHRFFDVFRNRQAMDRRYVGYHTWEIIQPDDIRIPLLIPEDEINSGNIPQNPR